jgi:hypothetical protein
MGHPPGTIGILTGDLTRYAWFHSDMMQMFAQMPQGTQIVHIRGHAIPEAVNMIIAQMQPESQWLQIHADDHRFSPELLLRLLDHNLPLVAPLVCLRSRGYRPSLFHEPRPGIFESYTWPELTGKTGLLAVDTFGGPCAVIRREVLETVGNPFFECMPGEHVVQPQEDLYTFSKCRRAGFQPYVDLDVMIGHCVPAVLYPLRLEDGQYGVRVWSNEDIGYLLPPETAAEVVDVKPELPAHV